MITAREPGFVEADCTTTPSAPVLREWHSVVVPVMRTVVSSPSSAGVETRGMPAAMLLHGLSDEPQLIESDAES